MSEEGRSTRLAGDWLASIAVVTYAARGEQTSPPCALKGPRVMRLGARWFFKDIRPGSSCRSVRRERRERRQTLRVRSAGCSYDNPRLHFPLCRSPRKRGRRSARARTRGQVDRMADPASSALFSPSFAAASTTGPTWCVVTGWLAAVVGTGSGRERVREETAERGRGEKRFLRVSLYTRGTPFLLNVSKRRLNAKEKRLP